MSDYPELSAHWFYAADVPLRDPNKKQTTTSSTTSTASALSNSNKPYPSKLPTHWIPFSLRDSKTLEAAFKAGTPKKVLCNEDFLYEVDIQNRELGPLYWSGPTYEVIRATWFYQNDGKYHPCNENLATQVEEGYKKRKAWLPPPEDDQSDPIQERLFGKYLSQYAVYTNSVTAWLLSDGMTGNLTKAVFTKLTNGVHLGGFRLLRGYNEVKKHFHFSRKSSGDEDTKQKSESDNNTRNVSTPDLDDDDDEVEGEGEEKVIDHLILVIHGIGQKLSERMESLNIVNDVNTLRKTIYTCTAGTKNKSDSSDPNSFERNSRKFGSSIQVLPIQWRHDIKFGMASEDENIQRDLGMPEAEEGHTTLDEITLEAVPNFRLLISDVLLDILLYMTPKYREVMINTVTREVNKVYNLFVENNPKFIENGGKVSLFGHSLGSVVAFDLLCRQPPISPSSSAGIFEERGQVSTSDVVKLDFDVTNFFAAGSPLGLFLLLKGLKIASRKDYNTRDSKQVGASAFGMEDNTNNSAVPLCYPAVKNLYNIFSSTDPIAYRLEPLIARHYGRDLKPALIPYHKGGLRGMHIGIQEFGNEIANKATNILSSVKTSFMFSKVLPQNINNASVKRSTSVPVNNSGSGENDENISNGTSLPKHSSSAPDLLESNDSHNDGANRIRNLNSTGRVDWVLQEGFLDVSYIHAVTVHLSYWSDLDTVNFIVREIYKDYNQEKIVSG